MAGSDWDAHVVSSGPTYSTAAERTAIDYRLAPEVKLPEIIADVEDTFRWLHSDGAKECRFDASRVIATGDSAGAGHGLSGGERKLVADAHAKALAFIRGRMK